MKRTSLHHRQRWIAIVMGAAMLLSAIGTPSVLAQQKKTHYTDVSAGVWYEDAAAGLLQINALDRSELRLRPNDLATRAEMVKLLVSINGIDYVPPSSQTFDDVPTWAWFYSFFESAAQHGWVRGDNDCARQYHPCTGRPNDQVNRAEAAALLVRVFSLQYTGAAPVFPDNTRRQQWYYMALQTAADACVLTGDDFSGRVRPASFMNRAEMVAMMYRASQNLKYGTDCGTISEEPRLLSATVMDQQHVRLTFNMELNARAEEENRFIVTKISSGERSTIVSATRIGSRSVDLMLGSKLSSQTAYRVNTTDLATVSGRIFSDSTTFTTGQFEESAKIDTVTTTATNTVRVTFTSDLDPLRAEESFRYTVTGEEGAQSVRSVVQLTNRSVEVRMQNDLRMQAQYTLNVNGMRTVDGTVFSDSRTFLVSNSTVSLHANLRASNEVPPVLTPGGQAMGTGTFVLTSNGLQYDITVSGFSGATITAAHFHLAPVGVNGPVVEGITFSGNHASGTWTDLTQNERDAILTGRIYVNVHTTLYSDGHIRGQVIKN